MPAFVSARLRLDTWRCKCITNRRSWSDNTETKHWVGAGMRRFLETQTRTVGPLAIIIPFRVVFGIFIRLLMIVVYSHKALCRK